MAKGPEKNTKNKALHTKLLNRKNAKLQQEKKEKALRLKALVAKMNQKKNSEEPEHINRIVFLFCFILPEICTQLFKLKSHGIW